MQIDRDANDEIAYNESIPNSLPNAHNYGITASFLGDDISVYEIEPLHPEREFGWRGSIWLKHG